MYDDLFGKTVLITGGTGGLGRQLIFDFSSAGANLIIHGRNFTTEFDSWLESIVKDFNIRITKMSFDLDDEESIKASFRSIPASIEIDILVNNAGVAHGGLFQMTPINEIKQVFNINYFSQVLITQHVVRRMIRKGCGKIVNISSISGLDAKPGNVAYGASKAALIAFTRTLSAEMSSYGINVNCIASGLIETKMATMMEGKALKLMIEESGAGRLAQPKEISNIVLFLSSDQSDFINGQTLRVDGGSI
jgi:3-oxoacyl-[acyl-carrier protein] reductase